MFADAMMARPSCLLAVEREFAVRSGPVKARAVRSGVSSSGGYAQRAETVDPGDKIKSQMLYRLS